MPQIRQVVSESLQSTVRRLLPSQQGFTEDLQATNVITPIIDLTPTAEGSLLPEYLQSAWDFSTGHSTVTGTTSTLISNSGFWIVDVVAYAATGSAATGGSIQITDSLTTKVVWELNVLAAPATNFNAFVQNERFSVYLRAGDSLTATSNAANVNLDISYRNVADVNGNLKNPLGFVTQ